MARPVNRLTTEEIFQCVKDNVEKHLFASSAATSGEAVSLSDENFSNALHTLVNTPRPKSVTDVDTMCTTLSQLFALCQDDTYRWVSFVLALIHKRYHLKSPQAQEEASDVDEMDKGNAYMAVTGDGERLVFYVSVLYLFCYTLLAQTQRDNKALASGGAQAAVQVLCSVAPLAGGTRDVCSLIELFLRAILDEFLMRLDDGNSDTAINLTKHSSTLVAKALQEAETVIKEGGALTSFTEMIDLTGNTLDSDLDIVATMLDAEPNQGNDKETQNDKKQYPSTFHVFLPHHERGKSSGSKPKHEDSTRMSNRALIQSVAEILIWSATRVAQGETAFWSAYEALLQHNCEDDENDAAKACWHRIQTIARKKRQALNSYARSQGFMLANQFEMDAAAIRLGQIKRAKASDLTRLTKLATKQGNRPILKLVSARFTNPDRAPPASSVAEIMNSWVPLVRDSDANEELHKIQCQIQEAKIRATLTKLRSSRPIDLIRKAKVVCIEQSKMNKAAAVLLEAALCNFLVMDDSIEHEDRTKTMTLSQVVAKLNAIAAGAPEDKEELFPSMSDDDGTATTKAVINFIDRHVEDNTAVIFLTSANLRLPSDVMKQLVQRNCTLHCHDADDLGSRLDREKARTGDITISLAWDTEDDLDLHVYMPDGAHIYFGNRHSRCGKGMLDVDMNASPPYSKEAVENFFCGSLDDMVQAPPGKYKAVVQNYYYHAPGSQKSTKVQWRVRVQENGKTTDYRGECVGSGPRSDVTACEFEYKGRMIPFPREMKEESAFGTANLVGITSSTGQTLESLRNLMQVTWDLQELDRVRQLVDPEEGVVEAEEGETKTNEPDAEEETVEVQDSETKMNELESLEQTAGAIDTMQKDTREAERPRTSGHLEVTSRDRLNMVLCRLPARFHQMVSHAYGTESLLRACATKVARLMLKDNVPFRELEVSGYPQDVVSQVKELMKHGAVPAA